MIDQITSRAALYNRGFEAYYRGAARDAHHLGADAPGLESWLEGYDHAARADLLKPQAQVVKAAP